MHDVWIYPYRTFSPKKAFVDLSMTCRRLRALSLPKLFRTLQLGPSWSAEQCLYVLKRLQSHPEIAVHARHLHVGLWLTHISNDKLPDEVLVSVAACLSQWTNIRKLTFTYAYHHETLSQRWAGTVSAQFPSIKELVLSPEAHWLIPACPNVESVSTNDWVFRPHQHLAMIAQAASAAHLSHLIVQSCSLASAPVRSVRDFIPQLASLSLTGHSRTGDFEHVFRELHAFTALDTLSFSGVYLDSGVPDWAYAHAHSTRQSGATRVQGRPWKPEKLLHAIGRALWQSHSQYADQGIDSGEEINTLATAQKVLSLALYVSMHRLTTLVLGESFRCSASRNGSTAVCISWKAAWSNPGSYSRGQWYADALSVPQSPAVEQGVLSPLAFSDVLSTHTLDRRDMELDNESLSLDDG